MPESGLLVLFDSTSVEHEVLVTQRERTCLIGWFHTPISHGGTAVDDAFTTGIAESEGEDEGWALIREDPLEQLLPV